MTKLLVWMKDKIQLNLVNFTFEKVESEINQRNNDLFVKVYNHLYTKTEQNLLSSLPDGYLPEVNRFLTNARGYNVEVGSNACWRRPYSSESKLVLRATTKDCGRRIDITDAKLTDEIQKFAMDIEKLKENRNNFSNKVSSAIRRMSTIKQFIEAFPDYESFLGNDFFGAKVGQTNAIATTAKEVMCTVAKFRDEPRDGCCDGEVAA